MITASARLRLLRNTALAAAFAALPLLHAAAFAVLPDILTSTTVPANGDVNPYGVAIVPKGFPPGSAINPGDILVSNFNNKNNLQGTGSTIIKLTPNGVIAPEGTASVFYDGGSGHGLTTALGVLQRGYVLVGNVRRPTAPPRRSSRARCSSSTTTASRSRPFRDRRLTDLGTSPSSTASTVRRSLSPMC
jgi:hypothetical protein